MGKTIASGLFIVRKDNKLLICHPTNHPKNQYTHSRKKATHISEFVANRRLSYNRAVGNGGRYQYHWQLISAGCGVLKLGSKPTQWRRCGSD